MLRFHAQHPTLVPAPRLWVAELESQVHEKDEQIKALRGRVDDLEKSVPVAAPAPAAATAASAPSEEVRALKARVAELESENAAMR